MTKYPDILSYIAWCCIVISLLVIAIFSIYNSLFPNQEGKEVTFNVIGIENATNSSISVVQLECFKYCIDKARAESICEENCLKIGRCEND